MSRVLTKTDFLPRLCCAPPRVFPWAQVNSALFLQQPQIAAQHQQRSSLSILKAAVTVDDVTVNFLSVWQLTITSFLSNFTTWTCIGDHQTWQRQVDPALCVFKTKQVCLLMEVSVLIGKKSGQGYLTICFLFYCLSRKRSDILTKHSIAVITVGI